MNKIITAGCVALAATTALAMPNKQELAKAKPLVEDVTKADLAAYKAGNMTAKNVADSHVLLAQKAGSQAEKYLLYQGAFKLYARSGEYDLAAEAIGALKREIKDLPPAAIAEIVGDELRYVSDAKAPRLAAMLKEAQNSLAKNQLDKIEKIIIEGKNTIDGTIWSYRIQDGNVEIVGVSPQPKGHLTIPSTLNGHRVTSIGWEAFRGCSGIASVSIPSSVRKISPRSFFNCRNLESVTIPEGVTNIGWCAFRNCFGLKTIVIPASMTHIEPNPFDACVNMTSISVDPANPIYCSRNGVICSKDGRTLVIGVNSKDVMIPPSVTSIDPESFHGCCGMVSVTIPPSVTNIGKMAFSYCASLRSVTILGERPGTSDGVFIACGSLKAIHVPANAKSWAGMTEWQGKKLVFDAK